MLERLREEWRRGCAGGQSFAIAASQMKHLRAAAATLQAAAAVDEIEGRFAAYRLLDADGRRAELPRIADLLKGLKPLLREPATPPTPLGLLERAVAPSRAEAKRTAAAKADRSAEGTRVVAPVRQADQDDPVTVLPRVGDMVAKKLKKLKLETVGDVLRYRPRDHIDYSKTSKICDILLRPPGELVTVRGEVVDVQLVRGAGTPRVVAKIADGTGWVRATWFNRYLVGQIAIGDEIAVSGEVETGYGPLSFTSPEWEHVSGPKARNLSTGRLTPVYPLTEGIHQKTLRPLTRAALDATKGTLEEHLPDAIRLADGVRSPTLVDAYEMLHYPATQSEKEAAERRFAFDDLLLLQIGLGRRRLERSAVEGPVMAADPATLAAFRAALPFELTGAQQRALDEIEADLARPRPMARLLQGDVGSGKTAVAAAAMLVAKTSGYQSAMLAPTQVLAEQHERGLRALFAGLPEELEPRLELLTGNTQAKARRETLAAVAAGVVDILVGTHALLEEAVGFARLGLTVVDEQHRFGVRQRATLPDKATGKVPHLLSMTATPIPRTLNQVLHGDIEVSVIAERPPGRTPVETCRYVGRERDEAYALVRRQVEAGRQVFVICPLVEASEATEAKAAVEEAARLQAEVFPDLRIATLHGRMSGKEKDRVMTAFRERESDILVSTSVIEVGIDVPNATVMLIEGADRFGLAQLHQFRGRVGRGGDASWCLLLADEATPQGEERLRMMVETDDGFALAEKDLELRGPGDFIGTRQSGLPEMTWIDGAFDMLLLDRARRIADDLLTSDPELSRPEHRLLADQLEVFWKRAAPDVAV